jgi:hypothetical protein
MWAVARGLQPGPVAGGALLCVASAAVVAFSRQSMRMGDMFPELGRVPVIRRIVG